MTGSAPSVRGRALSRLQEIDEIRASRKSTSAYPPNVMELVELQRERDEVERENTERRAVALQRIIEDDARDYGSHLETLDESKEGRRMTVARTLAALAAANDPSTIFVRGGQLARLRRDERDRPSIETLTADTLSAELNHIVRFVRDKRLPEKDGGGFKTIEAGRPRYLEDDLLSETAWPGIPPLETLVEAPVLRDNGTVVDQAGYDAGSRHYYAPSATLRLPAIPDRPSAAQVDAARELLLGELLHGFPFAGESDRANALGAALTPIVRATVGSVPLAAVDATRAGTGKGKLVTAVAQIHTGRPAGVFTAPENEAEWGKSITALLDGGAALVLIDEATSLGSPALAAALTADVYEARRLGQSKMIRVPQRATWFAAGNNIELRGDLVRRAYRIRLDAKMAQPWTRSGFRHPDLEGWVAEHRGQLLAALLTLARAWHAAGCPAAPGPSIGGFQRWADTIGGILAHAGVPGFLGNIAELYADGDHDSTAWEAFLTAIDSHFHGDRFTTGELAEALSTPEFSDALPDELASKTHTPGFKAALGKALRSRLDTRHGEYGWHIADAGRDSHTKRPTWIVLADAESDSTELRGVRGVAGGYPFPRARQKVISTRAGAGQTPPATPAPPADTPDGATHRSVAEAEASGAPNVLHAEWGASR